MTFSTHSFSIFTQRPRPLPLVPLALWGLCWLTSEDCQNGVFSCLILNSTFLCVVSKHSLSSSCFCKSILHSPRSSFSLSLKFTDSALTLHKSLGTHMQRLNPAAQKVRQSSQGAEVVPTLHTRHTPSANNKSPLDIKVPFPHSPESKSPVGRKPD